MPLLMVGVLISACAVKFEVQTTVMAVTALPPGIVTLLPTQFQPVATALPPGVDYTVVANDTCLSIAARFNISLQALIDANGLSQACPLAVNQTLRIPQPANALVVASATSIPPSQEPTATPDPYSDYFVESLRARSYVGGPIEIVNTLAQTDTYTTYTIAYPSDGLRISGLMNVPVGAGPFPVVVLNHGHIDETLYKPGDDTKAAADFFARQGFLTLAPDYRNHAEADKGENLFRTGYVVDVLNLIASVKTLKQAKADSIVVWGHSMGGGVSLEVAVVNPPNVKGYVLYAPMSGDFTANYYRIAWFRGWATPGPDWPLPPESDLQAYAELSPINYLADIQIPIRIHQGYIDDQVPADWSLHLNTALTLAGKDTQLYEYAGANHNFYNADWDLFMNRCLEFYKQVLSQ
jgi:uncharacterized protein